MNDLRWRDRLLVSAQYLIPQRALTRLIYHAARWSFPPWRRALIAAFARHYHVDLDQAADPDPESYPSFNAFFTRSLREGARTFERSPRNVLAPADGHISQIGTIDGQLILQAKKHHYALADLIGDSRTATRFENGSFITVYLSPRDYHRVHMPVAGRLHSTRYIPGRLFSVNERSTAAIDDLFARNERLVCLFESECGPVAVVMVGAMCVAGIETVWDGLIRSPSRIVRYPACELGQGEELGRFNMGSTVIVVFPAGAVEWSEGLAADAPLRVGQRIGAVEYE